MGFYYNTMLMNKYIIDKIPIEYYYFSEESFMEDSNLLSKETLLKRCNTLVAHPNYVYLTREEDYVKIKLELGNNAKFFIKPNGGKK